MPAHVLNATTGWACGSGRRGGNGGLRDSTQKRQRNNSSQSGSDHESDHRRSRRGSIQTPVATDRFQVRPMTPVGQLPTVALSTPCVRCGTGTRRSSAGSRLTALGQLPTLALRRSGSALAWTTDALQVNELSYVHCPRPWLGLAAGLRVAAVAITGWLRIHGTARFRFGNRPTSPQELPESSHPAQLANIAKSCHDRCKDRRGASTCRR